MVIFYNINNEKLRDVVMVEHDVDSPTLPANMTNEEKIKYYKESNNMSFISLSKKVEGDIFGYKLSFNDNGEFLELIKNN